MGRRTAPSMEFGDARVPSTVVEIRGLVKVYRPAARAEIRAVDGLDLTVERGEVFGVLGPNGAGKTTTLEIIEGLTQRDGGSVTVLGLDPETCREDLMQRVGIQLQRSSYFEFLKLRELLDLFGGFYRRRRPPEDLLGLVGLADRQESLVSELSGGQAQRFSIAAALVNDPDLLLLDEPTTGLDPRSRRVVWDLIETIAAGGTTVILTTHSMEEADRLSDRVAIIHHGRIVAVGPPEQLILSHTVGATVEFRCAGAEVGDFNGVLGVLASSERGGGQIQLRVADVDVAVPSVLRTASQRGLVLHDLILRRPTLEDVFLSLTGDRLITTGGRP